MSPSLLTLLTLLAVGGQGEEDNPAPPAPPPAPVFIEGTVFERGTRQPLEAADVLVDGTLSGETDEKGRFHVPLSPGIHSLQLRAAGHTPETVRVQEGRPPESLTIRLAKAAHDARYATVIRSVSAQPSPFRLGPDEVARVPGSLGDPFRAIESAPGVATVAWPLPVYAIRGSNPGNTGYFLDDVRVPALFHFGWGPAVIHPSLIDSLEFYPGSYPVRFGRQVGGIVAATSRAPAEDLAHLSADVRLFDAGALASAPFHGGRGTALVAGRFSYTATLMSLSTSRLKLSYADAQMRFEHRLGAGRLTFLAFGSTDALDVKDSTSARDHLQMRFGRASLQFSSPFGPGRWGATVGVGADRSAAPFDEDALANVLRVASLSSHQRLWYKMSLHRALEAELGVDAETVWYRGALQHENLAVGDLGRSRRAVLTDGYLGVTWQPGSRLILMPAFREELYREGGATARSEGPRSAGKVRLFEELWLSLAIGHYSQLPSLPLQVSGFENFGLASYGLQTSWQSSAGVEGKLPVLAASLGVTAFYHRSTLSDLRDPNSGDYVLDDYLVRRDAEAYGVEVLLRRPPSEVLNGWLSYTLSRSVRLFEAGNVGPSVWDQRHVLNLVVGYRLGEWTLGAKGHLNTGRPVPVANTLPLQMARLPLYYQIDLRAERRFVFDRYTLTGYVELLNATFSRQIDGFAQDWNGRQPSGYLVAIPSIGVRGDF